MLRGGHLAYYVNVSKDYANKWTALAEARGQVASVGFSDDGITANGRLEVKANWDLPSDAFVADMYIGDALVAEGLAVREFKYDQPRYNRVLAAYETVPWTDSPVTNCVELHGTLRFNFRLNTDGLSGIKIESRTVSTAYDILKSDIRRVNVLGGDVNLDTCMDVDLSSNATRLTVPTSIYGLRENPQPHFVVLDVKPLASPYGPLLADLFEVRLATASTFTDWRLPPDANLYPVKVAYGPVSGRLKAAASASPLDFAALEPSVWPEADDVTVRLPFAYAAQGGETLVAYPGGPAGVLALAPSAYAVEATIRFKYGLTFTLTARLAVRTDRDLHAELPLLIKQDALDAARLIDVQTVTGASDV